MLRFSPRAWARLIFMRDMTDNEVGGFGIAKADDLLFVTDIVLVKQRVTCVSVCFEDEAVANYYDDQVDAGKKPEQFARIWCHSHPGSSPEPSLKDEDTFARVFGTCDWGVMMITAADGKSYARLRFNTGPKAEIQIPVCVDYDIEFEGTDFKAWRKEYHQNVIEDNIFNNKKTAAKPEQPEFFGYESFAGEDIVEQIDRMCPEERDMVLDELAVRSEFWQESEEYYE